MNDLQVLFKPIYAIKSKIDSHEITNGSFYISTDTQESFFDINNERIQIKDIITLPEESIKNSNPLSNVERIVVEGGGVEGINGTYELTSSSGTERSKVFTNTSNSNFKIVCDTEYIYSGYENTWGIIDESIDINYRSFYYCSNSNASLSDFANGVTFSIFEARRSRANCYILFSIK